jgi:hypothetical protein
VVASDELEVLLEIEVTSSPKGFKKELPPRYEVEFGLDLKSSSDRNRTRESRAGCVLEVRKLEDRLKIEEDVSSVPSNAPSIIFILPFLG